MENEAFVSYRDYPRQRRRLDRSLQKLWDQDLPGAPYVEQYLRHMQRRDLTANTLRAAFTRIQGFLRFLKHQGKIDLPSLVQNDLEVFVESEQDLGLKPVHRGSSHDKNKEISNKPLRDGILIVKKEQTEEAINAVGLEHDFEVLLAEAKIPHDNFPFGIERENIIKTIEFVNYYLIQDSRKFKTGGS